jgi:hypothetical protein
MATAKYKMVRVKEDTKIIFNNLKPKGLTDDVFMMELIRTYKDKCEDS